MSMLTIDEARGEVAVRQRDGTLAVYPMASAEAFEAVSAAWLRCGWDCKYVYGFTWLGRPVIQLPDDLLRVQELLWRARPDVVVETGVAHGGSLVFHASVLAAFGAGRVIGVDIDIRPHNRAAIESHPLASRITLIEGDSAAPVTQEAVRRQIGAEDRVLVVLDSGHTCGHVAAELQAFAPLVQPGGYIFVCDGIMQDLAGAPRAQADWSWNNPRAAVAEFLAAHPEFVAEEPEFPFNEGLVRRRVTYSPGGILRRREVAACGQ
jgi:cephalosporin hydroxylase